MAGFYSVVAAKIRTGPRRWLNSALALVLTLAVALPALAGGAGLTWDASTGAWVTGYYVYYGQSSQTYATKLDAGYQTSYTVPNLVAGETYYFTVAAYDAAGAESTYSNEAVVRIASPIPVVEFYNASLDHYFISISAQEISDLDHGVHEGWARTGPAFNAFADVAVGAYPVCRYYIPGSSESHFFSASVAECGMVLDKMKSDPNYAAFVYESPNAFYIGLPNADTGACAAEMVKVYRLWNNRVDSNHRFTADPTVRDQMVARGYVAEGYGPDAVAMCAPQ